VARYIDRRGKRSRSCSYFCALIAVNKRVVGRDLVIIRLGIRKPGIDITKDLTNRGQVNLGPACCASIYLVSDNIRFGIAFQERVICLSVAAAPRPVGAASGTPPVVVKVLSEL